VADTRVAFTVPSFAVEPWTITVSPGWTPCALLLAVRVTFDELVVRTRTVVPEESLT
jgi:hypothetical protein